MNIITVIVGLLVGAFAAVISFALASLVFNQFWSGLIALGFAIIAFAIIVRIRP